MPDHTCSPYRSGLFFRHRVFHQCFSTLHCEERTPRTNKADNRGNFVKGEKEPREALQAWNQAQIHNACYSTTSSGYSTHPLCRTSEECGKDAQEQSERSSKHYSDNKFLIMSLKTLTCEVESIVNGRQFTKVSDDPRDLNALTPKRLLLL